MQFNYVYIQSLVNRFIEFNDSLFNAKIYYYILSLVVIKNFIKLNPKAFDDEQ